MGLYKVGGSLWVRGSWDCTGGGGGGGSLWVVKELGFMGLYKVGGLGGGAFGSGVHGTVQGRGMGGGVPLGWYRSSRNWGSWGGGGGGGEEGAEL